MHWDGLWLPGTENSAAHECMHSADLRADQPGLMFVFFLHSRRTARFGKFCRSMFIDCHRYLDFVAKAAKGNGGVGAGICLDVGTGAGGKLYSRCFRRRANGIVTRLAGEYCCRVQFFDGGPWQQAGLFGQRKMAKAAAGCAFGAVYADHRRCGNAVVNKKAAKFAAFLV